MFEELKTKNEKISVYRDMDQQKNFSRAPGTDFSVTKTNEASRLVRCRHCGFPCDKDRDVRIKDETYAGFGISQGAKLSAGTSKGDARSIPAAGSVSPSVDQYHDRTIAGGCPCCGSFMYDPAMPIINTP